MERKTSQEVIDENAVTAKPLNRERTAVAGQVAANEEFREYVVSTLERLRTEALMESTGDIVMGDILQANLLTVRGRILALTEAFAFFNDCRNSVIREQTKEVNN